MYLCELALQRFGKCFFSMAVYASSYRGPASGLLFWWAWADVGCDVNSTHLTNSPIPTRTEAAISAVYCQNLKPHGREMGPKGCFSRINVGVSPDGGLVPLLSPAAPPGTAVRTSPRLRSNVPLPLSSFQKPLWRRERPPGMNISRFCALTPMSPRGKRLWNGRRRPLLKGRCCRCSWCPEVLQNRFQSVFGISQWFLVI